MSDVMLLGVLRMPVNENDPMCMAQFVSRAREAADRIESDADEITRLQTDNDSLQQVVRDEFAKREALEAENEALRERLENYEALKRMHRLDNYPNELSAKAWLLRKQAEAVEAAHKSTVLTTKGDHPNYERGFDDATEQFDEQMDRAVANLRTQADELERQSVEGEKEP